MLLKITRARDRTRLLYLQLATIQNEVEELELLTGKKDLDKFLFSFMLLSTSIIIWLLLIEPRILIHEIGHYFAYRVFSIPVKGMFFDPPRIEPVESITYIPPIQNAIVRISGGLFASGMSYIHLRRLGTNTIQNLRLHELGRWSLKISLFAILIEQLVNGLLEVLLNELYKQYRFSLGNIFMTASFLFSFAYYVFFIISKQLRQKNYI